jgi:hypothetical protein
MTRGRVQGIEEREEKLRKIMFTSENIFSSMNDKLKPLKMFKSFDLI